MLNPLFDRLESWHSARFARPWLGPLPMTRGLVLAALMMALIAVFANVKVRYDQGQIWKANPEVTEIAGAMSFSTADAPYFLGHAAMAKEGLPNSTYELSRRVYKKRLLERNPEIEQLKEYKQNDDLKFEEIVPTIKEEDAEFICEAKNDTIYPTLVNAGAFHRAYNNQPHHLKHNSTLNF